MAGRMMTDDDFEDTFADELEMMRDLDQNERDEFSSSFYSNEQETESRKRAHEVQDDSILATKKKKMTGNETGGDSVTCSNNAMIPKNSSLNLASNEGIHRTGRRPLQLSNKEDICSGHAYVRSGKGTCDNEFDENSGDLFVHAESEIFTMETGRRDDSAESGQDEGESEVVQESSILSHPPSSPHISVTGSYGRRVYLRLRTVESMRCLEQQRRSSSQSRTKLLTIPLAELKATVEEERHARLMEQSQAVLEALSDAQDVEETPPLFESEPTAVASESDRRVPTLDNQLWVDKYAPRLYTELLSDDGINRTLLSWLRLWDEVVFGTPTPLKSTGVKDGGQGGALKGGSRGGKLGTGGGRFVGGGGGSGGGGGGGGGPEGKGPKGARRFEKRFDYQNPDAFSVAEALDDNKRPKLMLALLCGPPGLGKTTLAHIIATHAGYNVVEMNASDDRSLEVFSQKVEAATQMKSSLAADSKPNCLIIDEIDGAPTPAINYLVDLVKVVKGKKANKGLLSRPIICICNDQYTPALRQLRQQALLLQFPPTITSRLASRLQQVVKKEGMKSDMATLISLCEKADNDVRACLNSLQFLGRQHKDLTVGLIQNACIGQKDAQRSLYSLWKEVFQLPTVGRKHGTSKVPLQFMDGGSNGCGQEGGRRSISSNAVRFHTLLSTAYAVGEYLKVANGLFENYLLVKFKDPKLDLVTLGHEWLVFHDILQHRVAVTQDYTCQSYLPYLSVVFHFLFAISSRSQVKYPSIGYEVTSSQQRNLHMLSSLLLGMPPPIKQNLTASTLSMEALPSLTDIISPTFRPVNTQLYSAQEKRQLASLVDTMISYGLMYKQERGSDGQYTYILDPNIEDVTHFLGLAQKRQLTYGAKQLIAREIEMEKLRRSEAIVTSKMQPSSGETSTERRKELPKKPFIPVVKEVTHEVDFFGRKVPIKTGQSKSNSSSGPTHPLWFRFNEGFSNAVRRPIYMKDLL